jgi:hypothetical protein
MIESPCSGDVATDDRDHAITRATSFKIRAMGVMFPRLEWAQLTVDQASHGSAMLLLHAARMFARENRDTTLLEAAIGLLPTAEMPFRISGRARKIVRATLESAGSDVGPLARMNRAASILSDLQEKEGLSGTIDGSVSLDTANVSINACKSLIADSLAIEYKALRRYTSPRALRLA